MPDQLTKKEFQAVLPPSLRKSINDDIIDDVNAMIANPDTIDQFKTNMLSWSSVLHNGKFKLTSYINAVKYVSYKMLNLSNKDAYAKTFPVKYNDFVARNVPRKTISAYCSVYHHSKLVTELIKQTIVPVWVLNQGHVQEAINTLVGVMATSKSDKARVDAATSLLTHLKQPEDIKMQLDLGIKSGSVVEELEGALALLAKKQKEMILDGADITEITNISVVKPKLIESTDE